MLILGLNAYHADSSAAIFHNGKIIAAAEEERFRRLKHWAGYPAEAIEFCLQKAGAQWQDLDVISTGRDPNARMPARLKFMFQHAGTSTKAIAERLENRRAVLSLENELAQQSGLSPSFFKKRLVPVEHHRSHLASAFFASPFENAAIVSIDGSGDFSTTMTAIGNGNRMQLLSSVNYPHSLGIFYSAFTQLLGFPHYGDEYKVMGMSAYGTPVYKKELDEVVQLQPGGTFKLNLRYFTNMAGNILRYEHNMPVIADLFSTKTEKDFGGKRQVHEAILQNHKDLAASVQAKTEEVIFYVLNHVQKKTGHTKLCLAGGVAQNSVANGKITANTGFDEVYIPPAAHDAGISMGAALYVQHAIKNMPRQPMITSCFGTDYSGEQVLFDEVDLDRIQIKRFADDELFQKIVHCLQQGGVVGWFAGAAEFGPRALGGRSILADPRRADSKEIINNKIKRRENFRPFAPSVLKEFCNEYFENDSPIPFMERVVVVRPEKRKLIPAVTHVDGTARVQTVDACSNSRYYELIHTFYKATGIPMLLNTSFNENEPIVQTPKQALNCFLRTDMDMLVVENNLIERI